MSIESRNNENSLSNENADNSLKIVDDEVKLRTEKLNEVIENQNNDNNTTTSINNVPLETKEEKICWICFASDDDDKLATWVQPCKCRGTTKWVHESCLYRWVDEKQKGNALRSVNCQQCRTEYIIIFPQMGKFASILESLDNLIKRLSPFLAAGVMVGSLYWTAVTYGAVTVLQVVGHKKGLTLMENGDPLVLLIGLPAIPAGLILGRMIRWEEAVIRLIRNRRNIVRKFPLRSLVLPYPDDDDEQTDENQQQQQQPQQQQQHQQLPPPPPTFSDPISATRVFCGALLLPTISSIVGKIFFDSIENTLHKTLLGGLVFISVKGLLKIYLRQQQYNRKKERKIVDYTEENIREYLNRGEILNQQQSSHNVTNNGSDHVV